MIKSNMNAKNLLVSFCAVAMVLFFVSTVSAADFSFNSVRVDNVVASNNPALIAGERVEVEVKFTSYVDASDVKIEVEIDRDSEASVIIGDVEAGMTYRGVLSLVVPYDFEDDEVSTDGILRVEVFSEDYSQEVEYDIRIQKPSYSSDIKSVSFSSSVDAGETFPVDIVLKNVGYNNLDDIYVTAKISALGVEKTAYFGDLVSLECCNNDPDCCDEDSEDTVSGRLYLEIPFGVSDGVYTLEVEVRNDDMVSSVVKQIIVENDFSSNVIATTLSQSAEAGENAEFSLLLVNPTNKLKVYRVVADSSDSLSTSASETVVAVAAGSSKTVRITANAESAGEYNFNVNVFSGEELLDTLTFNLSVDDSSSSVSDPVIILTIILAIIFIVLLVVLIVLVGKKPAKTEDFGESYY